MVWSRIHSVLCLLLMVTAAAPRSAVAQTASSPVPYSSVSELNLLLSELEQSSQAAQGDLAKLRIERWKTDSTNRRQTQANADSVQRNLRSALPQIISDLRASPENLSLTFKLYRNLGALYDVFSSVVESAEAFGSRDESQSLENDLRSLERSRRSFADRMETLAGAKEAEITRLHTELHKAQAAAPPAQAKKVVVDDTQPAKPTKKKAASKSTSKAAKPPAPAPTQPQSQQPQPQ